MRFSVFKNEIKLGEVNAASTLDAVAKFGGERRMWAMQIPAEDATPEGMQIVIPGCEKIQAAGPAQFTLF